MAIASCCDHFIIPNSSFGWWCAWLGEKPHSKVIHCGHHTIGKLAGNDLSDFWPERWIRNQKPSYKVPLKDVTFTIPVKYDHEDRKKNVDLMVCILQSSFDTNVIMMEQGGDKFEYMGKWLKYCVSDAKVFHRTKMLNDMASMSGTPYIVNYDCDITIPPMQMLQAVEELRSGTDMVYPYDGRFARMPRAQWFAQVERLLDIGIAGKTMFKGREHGHNSVGGCVLFKKQSFIDGGMENENMISFGPEDCERHDRFKKLGFTVKYVPGSLFHMDHFIGPDSGARNPYFKANHEEIERIREMDAAQLREYIDGWGWVTRYSPGYYKKINEGSERSAKAVFAALADIGIKPKTVADIGCGSGAWIQPGIEWTGVDHNASYLYENVKYIDCNLEQDFPEIGRHDMAICLEVAEHISERRAADLVKYLCSISDYVLFSAAIPKQGGTGHVNEQWQSWWGKIFWDCGFGASMKQPGIKRNDEIELWYQQNIVLYQKGGKGCVNDFVLPEYYEQITINL